MATAANEYAFKTISETEYLEEVPEGASVLVENGGAIIRVPGSGLGGGVKTAIIKDVNYDNMLAGIQTTVTAEAPVFNFECLNMTFEEAYQTVGNGEPLKVVMMLAAEGSVIMDCAVGYVSFASALALVPESNMYSGVLNTIWWSAGGISTEVPEMPK